MFAVDAVPASTRRAGTLDFCSTDVGRGRPVFGARFGAPHTPDEGRLDPDLGSLDPDLGSLDPDLGSLDPDSEGWARAVRRTGWFAAGAGATGADVRSLRHLESDFIPWLRCGFDRVPGSAPRVVNAGDPAALVATVPATFIGTDSAGPWPRGHREPAALPRGRRPTSCDNTHHT